MAEINPELKAAIQELLEDRNTSLEDGTPKYSFLDKLRIIDRGISFEKMQKGIDAKKKGSAFDDDFDEFDDLPPLPLEEGNAPDAPNEPE